jgi:hypothetical protein
MAMPNWREELKQFEKEMKEHPQQEAPLPSAESTPVAEAAATPEPIPNARQGTAAKKGETKSKSKAKPAESKPKAAPRQTTPSADTKKSNDRKSAGKESSKKSK